MVQASEVAKLLLYWANRNGDLLTNLKVQKLLYYAQAWYLVNFERPLFSDDIEAWDLGPVIRSIYNKYKRFGNGPIQVRENESVERAFSQQQLSFLSQFFQKFGGLSATALISMAHREAPWVDNYVKGQNNVIPTTQMRKYYTGLYERLRKRKNP